MNAETKERILQNYRRMSPAERLDWICLLWDRVEVLQKRQDRIIDAMWKDTEKATPDPCIVSKHGVN